ncbi:MAG: hypothetical protein IJY36_00215 [Coprobacter sp.]|nr:hypothetical protein [Coprobacter sp.]
MKKTFRKRAFYFYNKLEAERKTLFKSTVFSSVLLIIGYFVNNSSLFTGEATFKMHLFENLSLCFDSNDNDSIPSDIAYFNIAYDKCLSPVFINGDSIGLAQISDRYKINSFLKLLKKCDNYKLIVLDVFLDSIDNARFQNDSLAETIVSFGNRIILADRDDATFAYPQLKHLTSKAKYNVTKISKAFSRYKYMYGEEATIPLRLYQCLNSNVEYRRIGLLDWCNISPYIQDIFSLYFLNNKLIQNSLFLQFDKYTIAGYKKVITKDGSKLELYDYYNVGYILDNNIENVDILLSDYIDNKIVFIGDLSKDETDSHSTYMDTKKGSEILVKAYHSISDSLLLVSFPYILFWFIIFSLICFLIISDKPLVQRFKISDFISNKLTCFLISLISYSTLLSLAMLCDYFVFNRSYSLTIPIIFFTLLKLYIQYKKYV